MSKRLEYQEVKEEFGKYEYTLLSETYKSTDEKLKVKCPEGHVWYTSFHNFKSGNRCFECTNKDKNVNRKYTYEEVKSFIENEGYRLISSDYQNNRTKLDIICPEGHEYKVSLHDFKAGYRCQICSDKRRGIVERKDYSKVKKEYKAKFSFDVEGLNKKNRYDLYKSLLDYTGVEVRDYIECKICGKRSKNLDIRHLKSWHNLTKEEYLLQFPDSCLCSDSKKEVQSKIAIGNKSNTGKKKSLEQRKIISERQKGEGNSFYGKTHTKETMEKISKSSLTFKDYVFPSGKVVRIQGYEGLTIDYLLEQGVTEEDMVVHGSEMPTFDYIYKSNVHRYFPDLLIRFKNKIIETKSEWTYNLQKERNLAKRKACLDRGYDFSFYIWENQDLTVV